MHDVAKPETLKQGVKSKRRPIFLAILGVVAMFIAIFAVKALQIVKMAKTPQPPQITTVSSAVAKEENWAPTVSAVGSVSPVQGAVVSAELGGTVSEIRFQNGGTAKKGDVLLGLDASAEKGLLHTAESDLELARADLQRTRDLAARKVVSKAELDSAESKFGNKEGVVNQMRSMISKKEVRAPFDGQLGIRQVNIGQTINPGQQVVALTALDPVFVDFALPQHRLAQLNEGLEVHVRTETGGHEFKGKLTAINSMVDTVTRNVFLQATLPNPDHALRPGMFAKVDVVLADAGKSLVIPGTAVFHAPYGDSVFVIEKKKDEKTGKESQTIRQQFVRVSEERGDLVSINKGLKAGDVVVSTGVFKLRNGMSVTINNDLAPNAQANPTPADS